MLGHGFLLHGIGSLHTSTSVQLVFLSFWITLLLLAVGCWLLAVGAWPGIGLATQVGGYAGLITALLAFYASAVMVINESFRHTLLPTHDWAIGHPQGPLIGSETQKVLTHSKIPVLVYRGQ